MAPAVAHALGDVVSINNSIMIVAGDAAVAADWQGAGDDGLPGSDWEQCFQALHGDGGAASAVLPRTGGSLLAFHIDVGGWVRVFRHDDGTLALLEVAFADEELDEPDEDPAFLSYAAGPLDPAALDAGVVDAPSGALAFLPAPSSGAEIPGTVAAGGGEFDCGAETGLVVAGAAPRYRLWIEQAVEASWGGGARALLVPTAMTATPAGCGGGRCC